MFIVRVQDTPPRLQKGQEMVKRHLTKVNLVGGILPKITNYSFTWHLPNKVNLYVNLISTLKFKGIVA